MKNLFVIILITCIVMTSLLLGCDKPQEPGITTEPIGKRVSEILDDVTNQGADNFTADIRIDTGNSESAKIYIEINGGTGENYNIGSVSFGTGGYEWLE